MDEVFSKTLAFAKEYRHIAKDTPVELSMKLHVVNVKTLSRLLGDVETIVQVLDTQTSVQIDLSLGEAVVRMLLTIPQGIWMVDEIDSRGQYPPYLAEEKRVAINQLEQRHYYGGHYPTNELMDLLDVLLEPEPEAGDVEPEPESEEKSQDSGGLARLDYCDECWQKEPPQSFCFWKTRVPEPAQKQKLLVDDEVLLELFERLAKESEQEANKGHAGYEYDNTHSDLKYKFFTFCFIMLITLAIPVDPGDHKKYCCRKKE